MLNIPNKTDPEELAILLDSMNTVTARQPRPSRYNPQQRAARAFQALRAIAATDPDTEEDWDGVVWWERLNSKEDGSLAEHLNREGNPCDLALEWLKSIQQ